MYMSSVFVVQCLNLESEWKDAEQDGEYDPEGLQSARDFRVMLDRRGKITRLLVRTETAID